MSLGMKRGTVYLEEHQREWDLTASETIGQIKNILKDSAVDVQHIGSTSIKTIPAKPIIDIAVGVEDYESVLSKRDALEREGIVFRLDERPEQLLFVKGDFEKDTRTHHIHVVIINSEEWKNYINFRDFLNADNAAAQAYSNLKKELAERFPNDRVAYTEGKSRIISDLLFKASEWRKNANQNK